MASVFIIDDEFGKLATTYYKQFPQEPITGGFLALDAPATVKAMSMANLLAAIGGVKQGSDIVIVSHGNEHGMRMPLLPGKSEVRSETKTLSKLLDAESTAAAARDLKLDAKAVEALMRSRDAVLKLGLKHVAFRGCRIAENEYNLTRLKDFLGCGTVGGTKMLSTYAWAKPEVVKPKQFGSFWDNPKYHKYDGAVRGVFVSLLQKDHSVLTRLVFQGEGGLLAWIRETLFASAAETVARTLATSVPLHYLTAEPPIMPLDGTHKKREAGYTDYVFEV